jgi:spore coat protein CotH
VTLLWLAACAADPCGGGGDFTDPPTSHDGDGWLFDWTRINRVDLTIDAGSEDILRSERQFSKPRWEVPAEARIDGESLGIIHVRLRGGLGSFRPYDEKPSWHLDFNDFSGERFFGLEALDLDNGDSLSDQAGMAVYALAGVPASRTGYAQLFVNGVDRGLMSVVEDQDDRWLHRTMGEAHGRLYDGAYAMNGWTPLFLDFGQGEDAVFDLEEGDADGARDIARISSVVAVVRDGAPFSAFDAVLDVDRLHRLLAAERWLGNDDGYASHANNYKVYFPVDGKAVFAPWDMGGTFPDDGPDESLWEKPAGNLAELCFGDADCAATQDGMRAALDEAIMTSTLGFDVNAAADRVRDAAAADPWGSCDPDETERAQSVVLAWFDP